jgi:hypothetical protein
MSREEESLVPIIKILITISKRLVDKNRLSPVKKVQVRFVASDRRVACDQTVHLFVDG